MPWLLSSIAAWNTPGAKVELFIGAFIGAITFTASVIAYGKLSGKFGAKAVNFNGQHLLNLVMALAMVGFGGCTSSPTATPPS